MKFLSKPFLAVAMVAILAAILSTASAIDFSKPSVVISFGGYNKTIADLNALGQATGQPGMGSSLDMMAKMMIQGFDTLDPNKPWGMASYYSEETKPGRPSPFFIFIPVSDITKLVAMLEGFGLKGEKISDQFYKFQGPTQDESAEEDPIFIKQQGNWVFIAPKETPLDNLPTDPASLLGDLNKKYLFAVRVNAKNGGMKWLESFGGEMFQAATMGPQVGELLASGELDGKTPQEVAETVKKNSSSTSGLAQLGPAGVLLQQAGDQIDTLTLGVLFDKAGRKMKDLQLDLQVTAIPGTDLEKKIGSAIELTSDFAGFYDPTATIALNISSQGTKETIEQMTQKVAMFQQHAIEELAQHNLNEDELETAKEWIARLTKTIEATVVKGRLDTGFQLKYAPGKSVALFGIKVVNGQECDEVVRQLSELLAKEAGAPASIALDVGSIDGMKFHKIQPLPASPIFGEDPEVLVGISDEAVYVGIGKDSIKSLESVIQKSKSSNAQKLPIARISLDVPQMLQMVNNGSPEDEAPIPEEVLKMFGSSAGNNITIQMIPSKSGITYRLELSPSMIGTLLKSGMSSVMPMPGGGGGMPMMPMPR